MLDPILFRQNINETARQLERRGYQLNITAITELENKRKELQTHTQQLQNERNQISKKIGMAKAKGEDVNPILKQAEQLANQVKTAELQLEQLQQQLTQLQAEVPNIPHPSVPEGLLEEQNIVVRKFGNPKQFEFTPRDHVDLGEGLKLLDFANAAKISGARFVVLYDQLAKLQRALTRFMLDLHTKQHGYREVYVPYLVNKESLFGTGQLPKFWDDQFHVMGESELSLIPTAEVPVTNLFRDTIIEANQLPLKFVAHTPCFRSEAGSYGKDTRGMIRQHQFEKVELVQIVEPENSYQALEELTAHAEKVLQLLELPYQVVEHCAGDLGFSAAKGYDLEVWLPAQQRYREISSCSNFEAFQARRLQARWRNPETGKPELVHTLNGSGLAVGRTLVAILENYQDAKGNVHIPTVLLEYMDGVKVLQSSE